MAVLGVYPVVDALRNEPLQGAAAEGGLWALGYGATRRAPVWNWR